MCSGLLQGIMFAFNVLFWLFGGTLLGLGIWLAVDPTALELLGSGIGMDDTMMAAAVYTLIAIGALLFVVGGLGCFGAWGKGNRLIISLYITFVLIVMIAEIVVVVLVAVFWSSLDETIQASMYTDVNERYAAPNHEALTSSWNTMQRNWDCCGSYNFSDYEGSYFRDNAPVGTYVPDSCCIVNGTDCQTEAMQPFDTSSVYHYVETKGCYMGLEDWLEFNSIILISVTASFIALQILGVISATCKLAERNKD